MTKTGRIFSEVGIVILELPQKTGENEVPQLIKDSIILLKAQLITKDEFVPKRL